MKRLLGWAAIVALGCVSPSRARYLGGGYASLEDSSDIEGACRARVGAAQLAPLSRIELAVPSTPALSTAQVPASADGTVTAGASAQSSYVLDGGPLGQLRVDVRGALGLRVDASVNAPAPPVAFAQIATPPPSPVRGFLFGVDLRVYRKIAFIVDAGGDMCTASSGQRAPVDRAADHLVAALTGLPPDTEITLMSTAGAVRMLHPLPGDDGRRAAMQWTCNQFCIADTSLSVALLDAFSERPDVVVLMSTNGGSFNGAQNANMLDRDLQLSFTDPAKVLERVSGAVPVIAVDLGRGSAHLAAIAELTGGVVVRP
jgi:hypothetical protein